MLTEHASKEKMSQISILNAPTLRRPSVFITCTVCSFHRGRVDFTFYLSFKIAVMFHPIAELSLLSRASVENIRTMSGARSKEGQGCLCGGTCDASGSNGERVETMA